MAARIDGKALPACPVETTLLLIGDKWKVLILRDLMPGTKRFGELKKSIGSVSQKVLTAQLRDMEQKRSGSPEGLRGGSSSGRILFNRSGQKPEAYFRGPANLGRGVSGC